MAQLENYAHQMDQEIIEVNLERFESSPPFSPSSSEHTARDHEQAELEVEKLDLAAYASMTPLHDGIVFKVGGKGGLKRIQKRYFVLYPGLIVYYDHRTNYKRDKKHGLKRGKVIRLDGVYLSRTDSAPARMKYRVVLHTPHESNKHKELLIGFHHRKDKNMWIELLQTQNPDLGPSPREERGDSKNLPLYIRKMREIDYFDPKSRYHFSRLHSVPHSLHSTLSSSSDIKSLRNRSFSSLPADYRHLSSSQALLRDHKQLRAVSSLDTTSSEANSELEGSGRITFEVISEEESESDS